jgi:exodeoxyribonuclease-3
MRIDRLFLTAPLRNRVVWAEIDREARKGNYPLGIITPLVVGINCPSAQLDTGWVSGDSRIATRRRNQR